MSSIQSSAKPSQAKAKPDWRAIIEDWQSSGLSVSQYCRQQQVPEHQIHYYRRKYLTASPSTTSSRPSGFAQVAVQSTPISVLTLRFPNGLELSGFSSQQPQVIADMIKALS